MPLEPLPQMPNPHVQIPKITRNELKYLYEMEKQNVISATVHELIEMTKNSATRGETSLTTEVKNTQIVKGVTIKFGELSPYIKGAFTDCKVEMKIAGEGLTSITIDWS